MKKKIMQTLYRNPETKSPCYIIHNAFDVDSCDRIVEKYKDKVVRGSHVTEKGEVETDDIIRHSEIVFLAEEHSISNLLQNHIKVANHLAGWELDITSVEDVQFTKYGPKQHYSWHIDGNSCSLSKRRFAFQKSQGLSETVYPHLIDTCRKVSASLILNDDFSGGEFETAFLNNDKKGDLLIEKQIHKPKKGDAIIFPSYLNHRVRPVRVGTRYSLVVWAGGPPIK